MVKRFSSPETFISSFYLDCFQIVFYRIKPFKFIFAFINGFVAQRFEMQSALIEPNLRRNLDKWST